MVVFFGMQVCMLNFRGGLPSEFCFSTGFSPAVLDFSQLGVRCLRKVPLDVPLEVRGLMIRAY